MYLHVYLLNPWDEVAHFPKDKSSDARGGSDAHKQYPVFLRLKLLLDILYLQKGKGM